MMALFVAHLSHPGDVLDLRLSRGDDGLLHVEIIDCFGLPIIIPAGEGLRITNNGLAVTLTREETNAR